MTARPVLRAEDRSGLLHLAFESLADALSTGRRSLPTVESLPTSMRQPGACFVTLRSDGRLRGCIGTLSPRGAIGREVVANTLAAAFDDPRFPPVTLDDLDRLTLEVSVVGELQPLPVRDYRSLVGQVRPGVDGLLLTAPGHRGTLLPAVWQTLPRPGDFVAALWRKAGLSPGVWPEGLVVERYDAVEFGASRAIASRP
jgi:AmmeMemoRadiSam system protein A